MSGVREGEVWKLTFTSEVQTKEKGTTTRCCSVEPRGDILDPSPTEAARPWRHPKEEEGEAIEEPCARKDVKRRELAEK